MLCCYHSLTEIDRSTDGPCSLAGKIIYKLDICEQEQNVTRTGKGQQGGWVGRSTANDYSMLDQVTKLQRGQGMLLVKEETCILKFPCMSLTPLPASFGPHAGVFTFTPHNKYTMDDD